MNTEKEVTQLVNKEKKKDKIVLWFLIIVMIIIIWLLFQRFSTAFMGNGGTTPTGNMDIFEIKCNDNCSCNGNNQPNPSFSKLDDDSSLIDIFISKGTLNFDKNVTNYSVLLENNIDKITLRATKSSNKATVYYIYQKKVYSSFEDMPLSVGENVVSIAVIAESGNITNYRVTVTRLNKNGEVVKPIEKDSNKNLTNITISHGTLLFDKNIKNYTVSVDSDVQKITLIATKESEKATITYIYNGKNYDEFKNIEISNGNNVVTILVTAEDGTTASYIVNIKRKSLTDIDSLEWYSVNNLNIFSNPLYKGDAILAPGSSNSYEFIVKSKVNKKVSYQFTFQEESKYDINMKYRLKRNGKYIVGNENTWVSYQELNTSAMEIDPNKEDDFILDWKWFDGKNDNQIGKLQKDYTLSITLSAIIQE